MLVKYAGSHIKVNPRTDEAVLKAGIAFYPKEDDKSYVVQHVKIPVIPKGGYPGAVNEFGQPLDQHDYDNWLASLPKTWVTNPAFTHFIRIDPSTTKTQLEKQIQEIFSPDVLTSADRFLAERGALENEGFSKFRKMMAAGERLGSGLALPNDADFKAIVAQKHKDFRDIGGELDGKGKIIPIKHDSIDIGAAAEHRDYAQGKNITTVSKYNPANAPGSIASVQAYGLSGYDTEDCEVATFYVVSGDNLSTRDSEAIGTFPGGSVQTFSNLDMDVETGDYIGAFWTKGYLEYDYVSPGWWTKSGDYIPCTNAAFTPHPDDLGLLSLYGEGITPIYQSTGQGAITPTGALGLKTSISMGAGAVTPTGALGRNIFIGVGDGSIAPVGVLGRLIKLVVGSGSITPTGTLAAVMKFFQSVGEGAITPVGTLGRKISLAIGSGAITPVGTLGRKILIAVGNGSITPTGALNRLIKLAVGAGSITPLGTLARKIKLTVGSGAIAPVGTLGRYIFKAVGSGSITPTGALNRLIKLAVGAGSITPTGALTAIKKFFQSVGGGAITPVGALGRLIKIGVGAGVITPVGALGRLIKIAVGSGSITPIGALNGVIKLVVGSGVITPVGALNRLIKIAVGQGSIIPVGTLATFWEWITLTLKPRSLALTLQKRSLTLTLKARSLILTLIKRVGK